MKKIHIITFFLFVMLSINVHAQGSGWGKIKQLNTPVNGKFLRVILDIPTVHPWPSSNPHPNTGEVVECEALDMYIIPLDDTSASDRFVSLVMSAFHTQKSVSFWVPQCTVGQYWGMTRPQIHDIYIQ